MNKTTPTYIFLGSPEFAKIVLRALIAAGFPPLAVVVNPDKPVGRKKELTPVPVKTFAKENNIKVFEPVNITAEFTAEAKELEPEFLVIAAYAKIIPPALIAAPKLGVLGIHPSLLPKYRGTSPIQAAILAGEAETGVSIYRVNEKVDQGPVYAEKSITLAPTETYSELLPRLAKLGGELTAEILPKVYAGKIHPKPQEEKLATFTKKFRSEDAFISEETVVSALSGKNPREAERADRMVRALNPEPGVWTTKSGKRIKLLEAELNEGKLTLKRIQPEGKIPTSSGEVIKNTFGIN